MKKVYRLTSTIVYTNTFKRHLPKWKLITSYITITETQTKKNKTKISHSTNLLEPSHHQKKPSQQFWLLPASTSLLRRLDAHHRLAPIWCWCICWHISPSDWRNFAEAQSLAHRPCLKNECLEPKTHQNLKRKIIAEGKTSMIVFHVNLPGCTMILETLQLWVSEFRRSGTFQNSGRAHASSPPGASLPHTPPVYPPSDSYARNETKRWLQNGCNVAFTHGPPP